ncbi:MAG: hypothetical protein ACK5X3_11220 [Pseudomonadota bacterium]
MSPLSPSLRALLIGALGTTTLLGACTDKAAQARAEVDAAIPADYLARIDYDRYQGEAERARREIVLKRSELATAEAAVARRDRDGALEIRQLEADLVFARS